MLFFLRTCILSCFLFLFIVPSQAQVDEAYDTTIVILNRSSDDKNDRRRPRDRERDRNREPRDIKFSQGIFIGSAVGIDFWRNSFFAHASPYVGYSFGGILAVGIGLHYTYLSSNSLVAQVYGPKPLVRLRPFRFGALERIYLHGEMEFLTLEVKPRGLNTPYKDTENRINLGFGYTTNFDQGIGFYTELLFDINYIRFGAGSFNPFTYRIGLQYTF